MIAKRTNRKSPPTRLITIYGFEIFSYGLRFATQISESLEFLGAVEELEAPHSITAIEEADVAVVQVDAYKQGGFEACTRLEAQYPHLATLMLTNQDQDIYYAAALAVNARGIMQFHEPVVSMVEKIQQAAQGPIFTQSQLLRIEKWQTTTGDKLKMLSQREWEVFQLVAEGYKNREIGELLEISKNTVERHLSNLMDKLGLRSRTMMLNFYFGNQLNVFELLVCDKRLRERLFDRSRLSGLIDTGEQNPAEDPGNGGNGKNGKDAGIVQNSQEKKPEENNRIGDKAPDDQEE